jgi:hypothetical protein
MGFIIFLLVVGAVVVLFLVIGLALCLFSAIGGYDHDPYDDIVRHDEQMEELRRIRRNSGGPKEYHYHVTDARQINIYSGEKK